MEVNAGSKDDQDAEATIQAKQAQENQVANNSDAKDSKPISKDNDDVIVSNDQKKQASVKEINIEKTQNKKEEDKQEESNQQQKNDTKISEPATAAAVGQNQDIKAQPIKKEADTKLNADSQETQKEIPADEQKKPQPKKGKKGQVEVTENQQNKSTAQSSNKAKTQEQKIDDQKSKVVEEENQKQQQQAQKQQQDINKENKTNNIQAKESNQKASSANSTTQQDNQNSIVDGKKELTTAVAAVSVAPITASNFFKPQDNFHMNNTMYGSQMFKTPSSFTSSADFRFESPKKYSFSQLDRFQSKKPDFTQKATLSSVKCSPFPSSTQNFRSQAQFQKMKTHIADTTKKIDRNMERLKNLQSQLNMGRQRETSAGNYVIRTIIQLEDKQQKLEEKMINQYGKNITTQNIKKLMTSETKNNYLTIPSQQDAKAQQRPNYYNNIF